LKIYKDNNANISILNNEKILILGYGGQGSAFAKNLRDSKLKIHISLPAYRKSARIARDDGFKIISPSKIKDHYSMILFMIPDHIHGEFYGKYLKRYLLANTTLVFAHGYSVHFKTIIPPRDCDVIMVAPHGPGKDLRKKYLDDIGLSCFVGHYQDYSGNAHKKALAIAKAAGCTKTGAFQTTFEHEAIGDLFGEQVLLCGGLSELIAETFNILVKNGLPPDNAARHCRRCQSGDIRRSVGNR